VLAAAEPIAASFVLTAKLQPASLRDTSNSSKAGQNNSEMDFSKLVDGLKFQSATQLEQFILNEQTMNQGAVRTNESKL